MGGAIEPALIGGLGLVAGFIVFSVFIPLYRHKAWVATSAGRRNARGPNRAQAQCLVWLRTRRRTAKRSSASASDASSAKARRGAIALVDVEVE
jgi:hypothetical protein